MNKDCSVCLTTIIDNKIILECGHIYHKDCITNCFLNNIENCPNCRKKFTKKDKLNICCNNNVNHKKFNKFEIFNNE